MPLNPETAYIPLALGMSGKKDPRALSAPELAICRDAQFDDEGGLQPRLPFEAMSMAIVGGGFLTGVRRLAVNGDELLLFTTDRLYSWSERDQAWALRGLYLAPEVEEESNFTRSADQPFADRAELLGVALTTWVERNASGETVWIAGQDIETGSVIAGPTQIVGGGGSLLRRPRVVAQATRFLVIYWDDNSDRVFGAQIDPANLAAGFVAAGGSATDLAAVATTTGDYDVAVDATGVAYVMITSAGGTSYVAVRITDAFAITRTTKVRPANRISCAITAAGTQLFVIRWNSAAVAINADRLTPATLADISVATSLATPSGAVVNQLTCQVSDLAISGQFRCYAFWSSDETDDGAVSFDTERNFIDTAGTTGIAQTFVREVGVASHAFRFQGRVFVWLAFAMSSLATGMAEPLGFRAAFQNTFFLYGIDTDGSPIGPLAKAADNLGGGYGALAGHLPGVQDLGSGEFAWAATERRIVVLSDAVVAPGAPEKKKKVQTGYADRGPRTVRLTLDSDAARRCVRLGRTLYIAGGQITQYDGRVLAEVGFHVFPWMFDVTVVAGAPGAAIPVGSYVYKSTESWANATGEFERATTATATIASVTGSASIVTLASTNLFVTLKEAVSLELWRTLANPPEAADLHLATGLDPAVSGGNNEHTANDPTAYVVVFGDNLTDDALAKRERFPENGGVLENLAPPAAPIITATQDRILLARGRTIFYSKLREPGEVASFHDLLQLELPADGGQITGLTFQDETLVAFCERGLFAVPGIGFDNLGSGQNYGPAQVRALDVGAVSQEAIARTPRGILFKSRKGWYVLDGWRPLYIGQAVAEFDDEEVRSIDVVESQHQVRILLAERMLVWDYETNRERGGSWSEWTQPAPIHSVMWQGSQVLVDDGDVFIQGTDFSSALTRGLDVETGWIRPEEWQGYRRIWEVVALMEYRGACRLRMRLKRDYVETAFDDVYWSPTPAVVGAPLQFRHQPSIQQCQALKIRLTVEHPSIPNSPPVSSEGIRFTGLSIRYGADPGHLIRVPAAQTA